MSLVESGSSPRMRGTPDMNAENGGIPGIIPAHAGNTCLVLHRGIPVRDHPRACGEHLYTFASHAAVSGSSPRMRGTQCLVADLEDGDGIIPAHAGNTRAYTRTLPSARDHPRACGEHSDSASTNACFAGSSPRMRGTRPILKATRTPQGIIPAHAGNTNAHAGIF